MPLDFTSVGGVGTHSFRKVNVNLEEDYIYFKAGNIPGGIQDGRG